ncbi:GPW/gp25 family protein [Desulfovibrio mangrovi]|uniref:GPW/gp25 family protein n=1 Tax=Desulfovibrio mangrovi TaxID=2976983 RepID=UPI0022466748|nr:GPW/gp25 family protein [Desulfovibrio mangrovi]UZP67647.1 GPW/gp25 family protein [Desulfovibrio mangrovi]
MFLIDMRKTTRQIIGATGVAEILQNARNILGTTKGTVPLDRTFGVRMRFLDRPLPEAMAEYTGEIIAELQAQEPRLQVVSVSFADKPDDAVEGRLYPLVTISIQGA